MKLRWSSIVLAVVLALGFLVPAPASAATTYSMTVVSGNFQTIFPTQTFAPLVIKVSNSTGQPVANRSVLFEVLSGPGTIGGGTYERKLTGVDGRVTLTSLKGTGGLGTISFRATTDNAPSLDFGFAISDATFTSVFGDQQVVAAGSRFDSPYVRFAYSDGTTRSGMQITFTALGPITFSGGSRSATAVTDTLGEAQGPNIPGVPGGVGYVVIGAPGVPSKTVTLKSVAKPAITAIGSGQSVKAGQGPVQLRILARDDNGVPVNRHQVTYRVTSGSSAVWILPTNGVSTSTTDGYSALAVRGRSVSSATTVTIQATSPVMGPVNFTVTVTP